MGPKLALDHKPPQGVTSATHLSQRLSRMPKVAKSKESTSAQKKPAANTQQVSLLVGPDTSDPHRLAHTARTRAKKRAEDVYDWPFSIPREVMDTILSDPTLGVREHLLLAGGSTNAHMDVYVDDF